MREISGRKSFDVGFFFGTASFSAFLIDMARLLARVTPQKLKHCIIKYAERKFGALRDFRSFIISLC